MMIDAAVTGVCVTDPESRTSAAGKNFVRVLVDCGEPNKPQYCWISCFDDAAAKVRDMVKKGGKLYAEGRLQASIYQRNGESTVSLNLSARRLEILNLIGKRRFISDAKAKKTASEAYCADAPF